MSLFLKAISDLFSKKSDVKNDLSVKNKSNLDKIIWLLLTIILGSWSLITRFNSVGLRCIFVFLKSNFIYLFISLDLDLISWSNLSVSIPK